MAIDLTSIRKNRSARPYHLALLAAIYDGQSEDEYRADNSDDIDDAKDGIHDIIDDVDAAISADKTGLVTDVNALVDIYLPGEPDNTNMKADLLAAINAHFNFNAVTMKSDIDVVVDALSVTAVDKSDVLTTMRTELDAAIAADVVNFTYEDVWCEGTGQYEVRRDAGADPADSSLKHCDVCDGFGRKATEDEIEIIKPPVTVYP